MKGARERLNHTTLQVLLVEVESARREERGEGQRRRRCQYRCLLPSGDGRQLQYQQWVGGPRRAAHHYCPPVTGTIWCAASPIQCGTFSLPSAYPLTQCVVVPHMDCTQDSTQRTAKDGTTSAAQ